MKIIVCGCGKIGVTLLSALVAEGHDLVALDDNPAVIAEVTNIHDVIGVCGNGADCETLEDAGVRDADLFIAVTSSDELNMLACFLARRMGADHTIARIRNPEYNDASLDFMKRELELSMAINPELLAARELFDILRLPSAAKIETFSGKTFEMVELILREDSPLDGLSLRDLREKYRATVLICTVQRGDEVFIPLGDFVLKSGDRIGITASPAEIGKFMRQVGLITKKARSVMLLGGSRTAFYLAKMLSAAGAEVKIIERKPDVAQELAASLPGVSARSRSFFWKRDCGTPTPSSPSRGWTRRTSVCRSTPPPRTCRRSSPRSAGTSSRPWRTSWGWIPPSPPGGSSRTCWCSTPEPWKIPGIPRWRPSTS